MDGRTIDCRGLSCPLPVIRVKEALEQEGEPFAVLVDETIAVENISRFLGSHGVPFTVVKQEEGNLIQVELRN